MVIWLRARKEFADIRFQLLFIYIAEFREYGLPLLIIYIDIYMHLFLYIYICTYILLYILHFGFP